MTNSPSFDGRHIIIGVTGGIACYKTADLVSTLVQSGARVDVLMTAAATKFIAPLTFSSLTGRAVFDSPFAILEGHDPQHIRLAKNAHALLVAPCTMNMLSKLATGMADDPVSLVLAAIDRKNTPVLLAPSMNATMLSQPATQRNIHTLKQDGFTVLESDEGWQACKTVGKGRLLEPSHLLLALDAALNSNSCISS
ncbi:MAG: phosphopantothenoylcysteine decarboxylase [Planctomycetes bacterium]|nr:phosphopantothenoylcysteine decarboxylase [Planctomycetota bacterium]